MSDFSDFKKNKLPMFPWEGPPVPEKHFYRWAEKGTDKAPNNSIVCAIVNGIAGAVPGAAAGYVIGGWSLGPMVVGAVAFSILTGSAAGAGGASRDKRIFYWEK